MAKPVLGRGLGALLGGGPAKAPASPARSIKPENPVESAPPADQVLQVPLDQVVPSSLQPRKDFPEEALAELAESIREQGIIQPLIVRKRGDLYELIAGERRWRASRIAGKASVPVLVRDDEDRQILELMLVENLQREDLNPIEESLGYAELSREYGLTQEVIATRVGKSRTAVANALRLLQLPDSVQSLLRNGKLSTGHAKAILGLKIDSEQILAADRVVKAGLTVRETEQMVSEWGASPARRSSDRKSPSDRSAHVAAVETRLREIFATKVNLKYKTGKGAVEIKFFDDEDLNRILDLLGLKME